MSAQHCDLPDGQVQVTYRRDGEEVERRTYASRREASIESLLILFPGTSREWLERMHRRSNP